MKHIGIVILVAVLGVAVLFGGYFVSISNQEIRLRNAITAKQKDNESELDNMQKVIMQNAQVTQEQAKQIRELVTGYAESRTGDGNKGGSFINAVSEAVPNMDTAVFTNLQNTITATRNAWTMRQKEILDMKREHDNLRTTFPGSIFVGSRPAIEVQIVTSSRAQDDMRNGRDDNTNLFQSN